MRSPFFLAVVTAVLAGCALQPVSKPAHPAPLPTTSAAVQAAPRVVTVGERFISAQSSVDELDSLAVWTTEDGRARVLATAKSANRLAVFDGDSGERIADVGGRGEAPGEFKRPNGIAVHGDLAFVVERDNHRVQVLTMPGLKPLATFGASELRSPYGIWINEVGPGELDIYITDSFMYGARFDQLPPLKELSQRVKRFRVETNHDGALHAYAAGSFGDVTEAASLHVVESIAGDAANNRLLIADEDEKRPSTLREYTLAGVYTGRSLPQDAFAAQAEGVVLWDCGGGDGYWVAVDQLAPLTLFHFFDRRSLAPRGSFRGRVTAHTDGVALHAAGTPGFPSGVLYAVHDDRALTAFDLRDVARALMLSPRCIR